MEVSQLNIYSIGYVAQNKQLSSKIILVTPIEALPMLDGEVKANPTEVEAKGQNADGKSYTVKVNVDNAVEAEWLAIASPNRSTPPDVRRGERVILWRYGDEDKYYWSSTNLDENLRRLETAVWRFSGTTDEGVKELNEKNSYYLEVSTHRKAITLSTSKANGEPYGYVAQFNTDIGCFTVSDDVGNYFELDSQDTKLTLKNMDGTSLSLDKRNILLNAPDNIDAKAGKMIRLSVGGSVLTMTPGSTTLKTPNFIGLK